MGNLFIVVDKNDNIVGYKPKENIDPQHEYYRVSALRLTNSRGEILIAQRSFNKSHDPGKWGPAVAGTVEKDETYESNIIKETEEEIGLRGIQLIIGPKIQHEGTYKYFTQRFFAMIDKDIHEFTIDKKELEAIKWISPSDITKDIEINPDNYLSSMKKYLKAFTK